MDWLDETYQLIQEDKRDQLLLQMSMFPLARTANDSQALRWLNNYQRDLRGMIYGLTPWDRMQGSVRSTYRGKLQSGSISVVLDDPHMANHPLFRDAKVIK